MAVFCLTAPSSHQSFQLESKLDAAYPGDKKIKLYDASVWLVSDSDTNLPQEVFNKIFQGKESNNTSILITPVNAYWGMQNPQVWDWLESKVR
ncbi:hypothetical protein [Shewanella sp. YIC-542]|uniref:hypothetical protein n=1 Tax=Shewanella mytili TaxID=3377111 RepID=UPI00398E384C